MIFLVVGFDMMLLVVLDIGNVMCLSVKKLLIENVGDIEVGDILMIFVSDVESNVM